MFRPYEVYIGLRYTRAKRSNHFISFISMTSMAGVALGVTALIVVLSVMNGFEAELRERILGMTSHINVAQYDGRLEGWEALRDELLQEPDILGAAPYVEGEAMLRRGRALTGGLLRGVLPELEPTVSEVDQHMIAGRLSDLVAGGYGVVMGKALADALGLTVGDSVDIMIPQASVTPAGLIPRLRRFEVVGLFEVGMYEYDRSQAFIHLDDAARLYRLDGKVNGLRLRIDDLFRAPTVSQALTSKVPPGIYLSDWTRRHANFFRAIRTEKTVMFVILALIVAVAAFNIVSTLVMVVTDKQADIAVLRTVGATPLSVMTVFVVQGALLGVIGTLLGVVGGVTLALNVETLVPTLENLIGYQFLPADVYYISDLPSELQIDDVIRISLIALGLSFVSTLYPAWRASRVDPAEALRYE
ncbi:MAG: lipoprotein-releasing ABC transporter permease subunit [Pseudomonadota bacterium]|nr:lipoprotein-releasing ABC transporter permease subunit [Pseudomonadota bacterium]